VSNIIWKSSTPTFRKRSPQKEKDRKGQNQETKKEEWVTCTKLFPNLQQNMGKERVGDKVRKKPAGKMVKMDLCDG